MVLHRQQDQGLALTHPSNKASTTGMSSPRCHQKPRCACASPAGAQRDHAKIKGVTEIIFKACQGTTALQQDPPAWHSINQKNKMLDSWVESCSIIYKCKTYA